MACRKNPTERARVSAPPQRACSKWRAAETDPPLPRLEEGRDAVLGALSRVEDTDRAFKRRRIDSPVLTRDESTTPPAKGQIAHVTASPDDPIATCLVPRDRFSGRALRTARARTFSALRRRAVARGLTRLGRRVDEREFLSCRSRADRCGRCGDRWRFASALAAGETKVVYFLRVFQTAKPAKTRPSKPSSRLRHRSTRSSDLKETAAPRFSRKREGSDSNSEIGDSFFAYEQTVRALRRVFSSFPPASVSSCDRQTRDLPRRRHLSG
jgi:hypothetical protein